MNLSRSTIRFNTTTNDPGDVVEALAMRAFLAGTQPWSQTTDLERLRADATLLPPGVIASRVAIDRWGTHVLAEGDDWTLYIHRQSTRAAVVTVTATTRDVCDVILTRATEGAAEPPALEGCAADIGFWHCGDNGSQRRSRAVKVESWAAIRRNYPARAVASLDWLMRAEPERLTGRLILLHGPPGTGKTTIIRALADAWREWCQVECVLDPDRLLRDTSYLVDVVRRASEEDDDERRWRLVVLEDCDEMIRAHAKVESGQAVARLLNLTDGLMGAGLDVIFAISTNEQLSRLHPAVIRPGRCIAQIEVGRLSPAEARAWLGRPARIGPDGATLAELFALRGDLRMVEEEDDAAVGGLYL